MENDISQLRRLANKFNRSNFSGRDASNAMEQANDMLEGYGVESISIGDWSDRYWGGTVALYVNMGDTYVPTLIYDVKKQKFIVASWGDWYEKSGHYNNN